MGFGNGYDSGYSDAIEDVRSGKVAGLGPASGGGGAAPTPTPTHMTNAADRYVTVTVPEGLGRVRYVAPEFVTAAMDGATFNLQVPTGVPAGTVMNVDVIFQSKLDPDSVWVETTGSSIGVTAITVNGATLSGMPTLDTSEITGLADLVLWYDGASWVYVAAQKVWM